MQVLFFRYIILHFCYSNISLFMVYCYNLVTKLQGVILITKIINIVTYNVYKRNLISHSDIRKMQFGLQAFTNELSKFILLILIFKALDQLSLFLFSFVILLSIRTFSGGLHQSSNIKCFLISLTFFSLTVLLPTFITLTKTDGLYILGVSLVTIYLLSPMTSSFRPIANQKRRQAMKMFAVFFTILWSIMFYITIDHSTYFTAGLLTIALQALQLMIGKGEIQWKTRLH